jgi:uncharacterized membrane protein
VTESMLVFLSAAAAMFMVALLRSGASAELRAAIRTTLVVVLGWGLAYRRYGLESWPHLSPQVFGMLLVSVMAVVFAWLFHFRAIRMHSALPGAVTDRVNVGFAVLFATLFYTANVSAQSALIAILLVSGALVLAFGSR